MGAVSENVGTSRGERQRVMNINAAHAESK
jgi:hypothetical protein